MNQYILQYYVEAKVFLVSSFYVLSTSQLNKQVFPTIKTLHCNAYFHRFVKQQLDEKSKPFAISNKNNLCSHYIFPCNPFYVHVQSNKKTY